MSERRRSRRDILFGGIATAATSWRQKVYSVRFQGSVTAGVREDDAVGMKAAVGVDDQIVENDFDNVEFFNRPICNCSWVGDHWKVNAYLGDENFAWDGSNGEVMYECTPFCISDDTDLNTRVSVCRYPQEGYSLAPMFEGIHTKIYRACFVMGNTRTAGNFGNVAATSRQGLVGRASFNTFEARAREASGTLEPSACAYCDYVLQLVEFADKNMPMRGAVNLPWNGNVVAIKSCTNTNGRDLILISQYSSHLAVGMKVMIGSSQHGNNVAQQAEITGIEIGAPELRVCCRIIHPGVNPWDVAAYVSAYPYDNGDALMKVKASSGSPGSNTDGLHPCVWRGKENPWGNLWQLAADILVQGTSVYRLKDGEVYSSIQSKDTVIPKAYEMIGSITDTSGFIKSFQRKEVILPSVIGVAMNTYTASQYGKDTRNDMLDRIRIYRYGGYWSSGIGNMSIDTYDNPAESTINACARFYKN